MKRKLSGILVAAMALALIVGTSTRADAAFFAAVCNDLACTGGDDIIVQDNMAGDTIPTAGAINFSVAAFGYSLLVNTSQSKPVIGSAASPQLDLTFTATNTAPAGNIFLFASDTDFSGAHSFSLTLGGTNSGGSGSVTGRAWGGTNNNNFPANFSAANLLGTIGPLSGTPFSGSASGSLIPTVTPYALTIGVQINRPTAGTTTGDLNLSVPEPATMALFGLGLFGFGAASRRRKRQ